ncbi:hypothetical protein ACH4TE_33190 [Streptomyces sioyaensis]
MQLPRRAGSAGDVVPPGPSRLIDREGGGPDVWTSQLGKEQHQDA